MKHLRAYYPPGKCVYTDLETSYKHRGVWASEHFLIAGKKLYDRYHESDPKMTMDSATDIIISALSYRIIHGEDKMNPKDIRGGEKWTEKIKKMWSR